MFLSAYIFDSGLFMASSTECNIDGGQWRSQPDTLVVLCKFFCVYKPYKESISKEMNNDNDLNLHSMTKLSGWLRY